MVEVTVLAVAKMVMVVVLEEVFLVMVIIVKNFDLPENCFKYSQTKNGSPPSF